MKKSRKVILTIFLGAVWKFSLENVVFISLFTHGKNYVALDKSKLNNVNNQVKVFDSLNTEIVEKPTINGIKYVGLNELAPYTPNAFVAVEDKRFYKHNGVDVRRIAGAMLSNVKSGSFKEGASTVSQQLIKNTHLSNEKTLKRKMNEALLAVELENDYTKDEILEMYLNTIYFGRNAYGIENAANAYFNKSAKDLTLSESATLASIIKAPSTYSPDKNKQKCTDRRNLVLKLMQEQGYTTQNETEQAKAQDIVCTPYSDSITNGYQYSALSEACELLNMTMQQLCSKKYMVYTYLDTDLQHELENAANNSAITDKNGNEVLPTFIISTNDGKIVASTVNGSCFARRQIGSTAKPFAVYAPALNEKLITTASPILDEETNFGGYTPRNYGNVYHGWITAKTAVSKSLNVPAVKTLNALTTQKARKYLAKMDIYAQDDLSLALGNVEGGLTDKQLLSAYCTLSNGGMYNKASYVRKIIDENGNTIYTDKQQNVRVFDESTAFLMTDMLVETAQNGTASQLGKIVNNVAAKTGTVGTEDGNSDALVAGYTPNYTFVCRYFGELPNNVTGSTAPCTFTARMLAKLPKNSGNFTVPKSVERLAVDKRDLQENQLVNLANNANCEYYYFATNNKPTNYALPFEEYKLTATEIDGIIYITMPEIDYQIRVYKVGFGEFYAGNASTFVDYNTIGGNNSYYAELYKDGKKVYTTATVTVVMPDKKEQNSNNSPSQSATDDTTPNIIDFWYFR